MKILAKTLAEKYLELRVSTFCSFMKKGFGYGMEVKLLH